MKFIYNYKSPNFDKRKKGTSLKYIILHYTAMRNYKEAINLFPEIENLILEELESLAHAIMQDAYYSFNENELYMVLKSLKDLLEVQPSMANEIDPYILKLETRITSVNSGKLNQHTQNYILEKKHESLLLPETVLQLGMTQKEVEIIHGKPKYINLQIENNQHFEMWTYPKDSDISHLYFRDKMLIRIEK